MFFLIFIFFFSIWIVLSGKFDAFHISLGIISSLLVIYTSSDLLKLNTSLFYNIKVFIKFLFYIPWLVFQIIKSNINVSMIILSKNIDKNISPLIFTYETKLKNNLAKVLFANSITLTPGTVTISLLGDKLIIHTLKEKGTLEGIRAIENKLLKVFG